MATVTVKCEPALNTNEENVSDPVTTFEARKAFLQANNAKGRKVHRKRRHSLNEDGNNTIGRKHRRQASSHQKKGSAGDIILPTNFLLGGNISDPLNLNSLLDENISKALNAVTPKSSPLPPRSSTVNIVIPPDMTDPLGLNNPPEGTANQAENTNSAQETSAGNEPLKANAKKKRKRRKSQHEKLASSDTAIDQSDKDVSSQVDDNITTNKSKSHRIKKLPLNALSIEQTDVVQQTLCTKAASVDPIVSPVIPQDLKPSLSASKSRRKRGSVTSGKHLTFHIPEASQTVVKPAQENNDDLTLATPIEESMPSNETAAVKNLSCNDDGKLLPKPSSSKDNGQQHKRFFGNYNQPKSKPASARFQFGNYSQYYGYRNPQKFKDERMNYLKKDWFKDKDVLDVGCNVGHLTVLIARDFQPRKIVGIDIDHSLIKSARMNIRHYSTANTRPSQQNGKYPECMSVQYGPIHGPPLETGKNDMPSFPNNVKFFMGNYVPEKDDVLKYQEPEYDVILCMSVTKWIHLNWGDEGLIKTFQRFYKQLRPGGKLILEPQDMSSYRKKKKLTETIYQNFNKIQLKPSAFPQYLVKQIGFEKVDYLEVPSKDAKGFHRPIQLYTKPE